MFATWFTASPPWFKEAVRHVIKLLVKRKHWHVSTRVCIERELMNSDTESSIPVQKKSVSKHGDLLILFGKRNFHSWVDEPLRVDVQSFF